MKNENKRKQTKRKRKSKKSTIKVKYEMRFTRPIYTKILHCNTIWLCKKETILFGTEHLPNEKYLHKKKNERDGEWREEKLIIKSHFNSAEIGFGLLKFSYFDYALTKFAYVSFSQVRSERNLFSLHVM